MPFVLANTSTQKPKLQEGFAYISSSGQALFHESHLSRVQMGQRAAVLVNAETKEIALRSPFAGEKSYAVKVTDSAARVNVSAGFKALMEPRKKMVVPVRTQSDLLIIKLP